MGRLAIHLLGSFRVTLDGAPASGFESDKVRALLSYLAVEVDRPHRREKLAGLLWPEWPEQSARINLSRALANLRQVIGDAEATPPFLDVTRQAIQLNQVSDTWVDVTAFLRLLEVGKVRRPTIAQLEEAVALVRGDFLEGFGLKDSPEFEAWLLLQREHLARLRLEALHRLAECHQAQGDFEAALGYAWKQVELDPLQEGAQNQLMVLLAVSGQRTAALAQYEALRRVLHEELGAQPSAGTKALYRRILSGELAPASDAQRRGIIRGYDLLERIGEGTVGAVYRAYQPVLGREVAVKMIRPEYANQPEFVRRFEAEAQVVARLEHLHIVPLYDYWREPDGAYLVMRLFPAGSLHKALARGPWQLEVAARLVEQVASALAAAHGQGVVHGDLKPANILLDEAGNAYLSDFGVARQAGVAPDLGLAGLSAAPEYAAPELWQQEPVTPQADLYSLGVVLFSLLTGVHPFAGAAPQELRDRHLHAPLPAVSSLRAGLPPAVDEVLCRATAKAARDRYPDAVALVEAFRQSIEVAGIRVSPAAEVARPQPQNPYKGLRPFEEADASHFYGRGAMVERLLARLAPTPVLDEREASGGGGGRFLAVVGPSGSGKSSLVRAGLIPALRRNALPGSEGWFVTVMQPGAAPLDDLEGALLRIAVRGGEDLGDVLRHDGRGLLRAAELVLPEREADGKLSELFLVVDQFEELFAPEVEPVEREQLLQLLCTAVTEPGSRIRVVVTLRADFYDRPLQHPEFGVLMREWTEVALPLTAEELMEAIRGPAEQAGVELEMGLADAIVADVTEQPGALPMFQYALTELFERRQERRLTWEAYRAIGGVAGALAQSAEAVFAGLDEGGQSMARQLFLRLVKPGSGTEDKRRVHLSELQALQTAGVPQPLDVLTSILNAFGRVRLLLFDRDPTTRAPTVEMAHEALLRAWRRLREWLEESWADLRMERLLGLSTAEWIEAGRDPGYLLWGTRLAQFEGWAAESEMALTRDERAFLEASSAARQAREAEEEARRNRELEGARALAEEQRTRADVERHRAEDKARSAQRLRRRALYLAGALLVAVLLAVAAGFLGQRAVQNANLAATREAEALTNADRATSRELAAAALNLLDVDPELSVLLALEALSTAETLEAEGALHQAVPSLRLLRTFSGHTAPVVRAAVDQIGSRLATVGEDGLVRLWDLASGQELLALGKPANPHAVAFSPDGTYLAVGGLDGALGVWLVSATEPITAREALTLSAHTDSIQDVAFSPDGSRLATASADATAKVWDAHSGLELLTLSGHAQGKSLSEPPLRGVTQVAFDAAGTLLATAGADATVRLWDSVTGLELQELSGHQRAIAGMDLCPGGTCLATASEDGTVRLWDLAPGSTQGQTVYSIALRADSVVFSPDGTRLAVVGTNGLSRVLNTADGQELMVLAGHPGRWGISFTPDGQGLITTGEDGAARLWDISASRELLTLKGTGAGVTFGTNGLLITGRPGGAMVWDLPSGSTGVLDATFGGISSRKRCAMVGHQGPDRGLVRNIALSPDSRLVATAGTDGTVRIWDRASCQELLKLPGHTGWVWDVGFSPNGQLLASAGADAAVKLWGTATGQLLLTLSGHGADVTGIDISPDGRWLASASWDRTVAIWDLDQALSEIETGEPSSAGQGASGQTANPLLFSLPLNADANDVAFSPDGTRLAACDQAGVVTVWEFPGSQARATEEPTQILSLSANNWRILRLAFSPDGKRLATAGGDGSTRIWDLDSGQELLTLSLHTSFVTGVAFSPDGARLATSGADHTIQLYALSLVDLAKLARQRLTRSLTDEECRRYLHQEPCPQRP